MIVALLVVGCLAAAVILITDGLWSRESNSYEEDL